MIAESSESDERQTYYAGLERLHHQVVVFWYAYHDDRQVDTWFGDHLGKVVEADFGAERVD